MSKAGSLCRAMLACVLGCGLSANVRADDRATLRMPPVEAVTRQPATKNQPRKSSRQKIAIRQVQHEESSPADARDDTSKEPAAAPGPLEVPSPAADPAWPNWSPTDNPARQPVYVQPGYYDLVRPPNGLYPEEDGQIYQRHVASEADLDFNCATCPQPIDIFRPDGVAPAGVIGDHTLNTLGRVMVSYKFSDTRFDGLLNGSGSISTASALTQFPIVPVNGTAQNHLFLLEYATSDDLTFQAILPFVQRHINYVDGLGNRYVTDMTDISDIQVYALYVIQRSEHQQVHLNLGVQIPTGIFIEQGDTPTPTSPNFSYPMRSSDGTWDFLPGITYRGQSNDWTWGAQGLGIVRFGINKFDYRLGDEGNFNAWGARRLTDWASLSARLNYHIMGNIYGSDGRLNPLLVPTNVPNLQAGQQLNVLFGMNLVIPEGFLKGQRVGVEGGIPVYQWLDGPQLQQQYQIWANLTLLF